jgi:hypothetical protein
VQFDVLSGYNPLPEKSTKDLAAKEKDSGLGEDGVKKKRAIAPKGVSPKTGVAKTPAQKGAAR